MIKKIYKLIKCILKIEMEGFYYLFLIISRGFFLIINIPFILLNKIINSEKIKGIIKTINKLQEKPVITLVITILFSSFILYEIYIYIPEDKTVKIADDIQTDIIKTNAKEEPEEEKEKAKAEETSENPKTGSTLYIYVIAFLLVSGLAC